jgi:hypothetical protein
MPAIACTYFHTSGAHTKFDNSIPQKLALTILEAPIDRWLFDVLQRPSMQFVKVFALRWSRFKLMVSTVIQNEASL